MYVQRRREGRDEKYEGGRNRAGMRSQSLFKVLGGRNWAHERVVGCNQPLHFQHGNFFTPRQNRAMQVRTSRTQGLVLLDLFLKLGLSGFSDSGSWYFRRFGRFISQLVVLVAQLPSWAFSVPVFFRFGLMSWRGESSAAPDPAIFFTQATIDREPGKLPPHFSNGLDLRTSKE